MGLPTGDCAGKQSESDLSMVAWPWPFCPSRAKDRNILLQIENKTKHNKEVKIRRVFSKASDSVSVTSEGGPATRLSKKMRRTVGKT